MKESEISELFKMNETFITISWIAPINLPNPTPFILHICEYCNPTFILCYKSYMVLNKTIQAKIAWQITFLKCHCHCCCATSIIIYSHCQRLKMPYNKQKVILSFFSSQKQILTKILYFQTILNKYKDVCSIPKCIQMIFVAYFLQKFCLARLSIISIFHSRCIQNCIFSHFSQ